jgi:putative tryptophan/tyrosine transport system substrate-binding protein
MHTRIGSAHGAHRHARGQGEELLRGLYTGGILLFALSVFVVPLISTAQPPGKVFRIGWLNLGFPAQPDLDGLRQGLGALGYVEGQNLVIEERYAEGKVERLSDLATELVRLPIHVLIAAGSAASRAAQQATSTIPIVMLTSTDAVAQGFVGSLARPGGNVTGLAGPGVALSGKRLEILKEAVPEVSRIAVLWNPANPTTVPFLPETQAAAQALGVELHVLEVRSPNDFEGAFAAATRGRAGALLVMPDAFLAGNSTRIVDFAHQHGLPGMYPVRDYVDAGGLMSYAPSWTAMFLRAATYVDKILKGVKPADLPVEQPTKFELVLNLKTAKALGITLPPTLLILADEVIQ